MNNEAAMILEFIDNHLVGNDRKVEPIMERPQVEEKPTNGLENAAAKSNRQPRPIRMPALQSKKSAERRFVRKHHRRQSYASLKTKRANVCAGLIGAARVKPTSRAISVTLLAKPPAWSLFMSSINL